MLNAELIPYFDNFSSGIVVVNSYGDYLYLNQAAVKLFGNRDQEALRGRTIFDTYPNSPLISVLETKTEKLLVKRKINAETVNLNCYPIFTRQGEFLGAIEFIEDYEKYDKNDNRYHKIKQLNNELQTIISNSSDGIFVTDGTGKVLTLNHASEIFMGIDKSYILGKNIALLEQKSIISASAIVEAIKRKERVTMYQTTQTGEKILVTANPIFDDSGDIEKVISNSRNITEILDLKEQIFKEKELAQFYKKELEQYTYINDIVAQSDVMQNIINMVKKVAEYDTTILLLGESGVGKNQIGNLIHRLSPRVKQPYISINCSAIPDSLFESELFGYNSGAFSGASKSGSIGKLELANHGTLLLDEVAELPLQQQAKILQVINEKTFMRVGGNEEISINVRIISATNKDLVQLVKAGAFREDLFYRLNVIKFEIPPLRERQEDIPILIKHYLDFFNEKYNINKKLNNQAARALERYEWPGNIRELKNIIEQMLILSENDLIIEADIPEHISKYQKLYLGNGDIEQMGSLEQLIENMERNVITQLYKKYKSSYKLAEVLKISQSTAMRKIRKYI